ncbi:MAG: hypothetical protein H7Y12_11895, partial [Sphingobacteriaceae bacterium]|nr:hypothetical protein [Cytophagaceae bacterium]
MTLPLFFRLLVGLSLASFHTLAQTPPPYVVGKVLDRDTGQGLDNASVTNPRTRQVGRTNRAGAYYLLVQPGDSILINSLTHGRGGLKWDGRTKEPTLTMQRLFADDAVMLAEVTVRGKREEQIRRELQQLLNEPKALKGLSEDQILGLAQSPITLLYELFSKQAKSRRKAAVLSQQYRRQRLADYRLDLVIGQATTLRGEEAEAFKKYCSLSDDFVLTATEYELTFEVLRWA